MGMFQRFAIILGLVLLITAPALAQEDTSYVHYPCITKAGGSYYERLGSVFDQRSDGWTQEIPAMLVDGDKTWLVHHYYDARDEGRVKLQIRPLTWDAVGRPVAGSPLTDAVTIPAAR